MLLTLLFAVIFVTRFTWAVDRTQEYETFVGKTPLLKPAQLALLKETKIIFIPGIVSEIFIGEHKDKVILSLTHFVGEYFNGQMEFCNKKEIPCERLTSIRSVSCLQNARTIINAVNKSKKPVILFAHSKGGVDTLTALVELYKFSPRVLDKIKGVVFLQSPLTGSIIADKLVSGELTTKIAEYLIKLMGGKVESIRSLSFAERKRFNDHNKVILMKLAQNLPILAVASWKEDDPLSITDYEITRMYLRGIGKRNDGVVAYDEMTLPEFDYISLTNIDHGQGVLKLREVDQEQLTERLIAFLLEMKQSGLANQDKMGAVHHSN